MFRTLSALALAAVALAAARAPAAEAAAADPAAPADRPRELEVRAWIGDRSQFASPFTVIPATLSLAAAVDFRIPLRAELQICWNPLFAGVQATASAGVPLRLYDGRRTGRSRLALKLPLQVAFGYAHARWEAEDGYHDEVSWILLGWTAGLDFTWWVRRAVGVCLLIGGSYLFRIADPGSRYADAPTYDYSAVHGEIGIGEIVVAAGMAFGAGID